MTPLAETDPVKKVNAVADALEELKRAQRRKELATERGVSTPNTKSEADSILQAEAQGKLKGKPRRPDAKKGEPDHDFALKGPDDKTVVGYAEIKTPVDAKLNSIAKQAADVAGKIKLYPKDPNLQIIIDLKNLVPTDKVHFLSDLKANGVDPSSVIILNG